MARPMTQQMDALRLLLQTQMSDREIGAATGLSKTTVGRYRKLATQKRLTWADAKAWSPAEIDNTFNRPHRGNKVRPPVDMATLHDMLTAQKMTLQVWFEDYARDNHPNHCAYSTLARGLRRYRETMPSFMHQVHRPGEKVMVDFSGDVVFYIDQSTGKRVNVDIFVGVLGASSYIYAQAIRSQSVPEVMDAHAKMFAFFGGVPQMVVPDNAKSFMTKPGPGGTAQRDYDDLARHYGLTIYAARAYHPKDKAKVEASVKFVQQQILTRLRSFTLYSIEEIQERILDLLPQINARPMGNKLPSRTQRFEAVERRTLRPLPVFPYEYAEIKSKLKVDGGYHIVVEHHRYSVPHALVGQRVDVRLTAKTVEVFHDQKLVARHARSSVVGGLTTVTSHQPEAHRAQAERTPEALQAWATTAGPTIARFVRHLFDQDRPYMGLRPADELKTLSSKYGVPAVERALLDFADLKFANITDLKRKLSIQAKKNAFTARPRSSNARGPASLTSS